MFVCFFPRSFVLGQMISESVCMCQRNGLIFFLRNALDTRRELKKTSLVCDINHNRNEVLN